MNIALAESDAEILACHPVMEHLRKLDGPDAFLAAVRSQNQSGYQLAYLTDGGPPLALAGFRLGQNLAWGRFLYVDDLVTLPEARSKGCGSRLLGWLVERAREAGAEQLHLDSGTERADAHRFYEREGFGVSSLHFKRLLRNT